MPSLVLIDMNTKADLYVVGSYNVLKIASSTQQNVVSINKESSILDITLYGWCRALILTDDVVKEV